MWKLAIILGFLMVQYLANGATPKTLPEDYLGYWSTERPHHHHA